MLDEFNLALKKHIAMASDEIFLTAEREIPNKNITEILFKLKME